MLFNKEIEPCCAYCAYGSRISEREAVCLRRGIVSSGGFCGRFRYDPLKREPEHHELLKYDPFSAEILPSDGTEQNEKSRNAAWRSCFFSFSSGRRISRPGRRSSS